jgi:hypothetical protein
MRVKSCTLLVAAGAVIFAGSAYGANPGPVQFPILGIGLGQTLRLTAVGKPPNLNFSPTGCIAELGFVDTSENPVAVNPGPVNKTVNLQPGQADYLDFPASQVLRTLGQRIELRPLPTVTPDPASGAGSDCDFFAEEFDAASGFSRVYRNPGPAGMPGDFGTFPLMGVALGQVLRLTAVTISPGPIGSPDGGTPGPCQVTLDFVDRSGAPVGRDPGPISFTFDPGQGGFLDIAAAGLVSQIGQRALIRPVITVDSVPGANPCMGVTGSAETFVRLTGATWSQISPGPSQ